jgi:phosphoglycolate phosphatase
MSDFASINQSKPKISFLVTDLDNTLWDWFEIWYRSFSAMLDAIVAISGLERTQLEAEIRTVHQRRGTSEYSYLIQELPTLQQRYPDADLGQIFKPAIDAYRAERKKAMVLYPTVLPTLRVIKDQGATVVAYTESFAYYTSYRLRKFELDGLIDFLYSPPDNDFPVGVAVAQLRTRPSEEYELRHTRHRHTPRNVRKPEPAVLRTIISEIAGGDYASVAYVGDSLMKDVAMAQAVGVADVHARYGVAQDRQEYELLRRVSHWTPEEVHREKMIASQSDVIPTYTLSDSFAELLDLFTFSAP